MVRGITAALTSDSGPEREVVTVQVGDDEPAILVSGLHKSYGGVEAVTGIEFEVHRGEIFGLLGPNGAGKTTTVEMLEGYRSRDRGQVQVLGVDPAHPTRAWRERIGIVTQTCQVEPELTVRESLELYAGYFRAPRSVDEVLELVGLSEVASRRASRLSGGQQRRLDVGVGLVGQPEVLFLDEPTTGFDPAARHQFWEVITRLRELGTTIILTTHYMDEAQALADRVAVIVRGRIVAAGAVAELGGRDVAAARIAFTLPLGISIDDLPVSVGAGLVRRDGQGVELRTTAQVPALNALTSWCLNQGVDLPDLEVTRPTLEDIYLELTASGAQE